MTFNGAFREVLFPGRATDDKEDPKNHPLPDDSPFWYRCFSCFHRILITMFIIPSLSFPMSTLASLSDYYSAKHCRALFPRLHTSSLPRTHAWVAIIGHLNLLPKFLQLLNRVYDHLAIQVQYRWGTHYLRVLWHITQT